MAAKTFEHAALDMVCYIQVPYRGKGRLFVNNLLLVTILQYRASVVLR